MPSGFEGPGLRGTGSVGKLRDRQSETERLDQLIASVRTGLSGALVVRGEAGIGKSALLENYLSGGSGCRIARCAGVESEMEFAYAGLHQLCGPYLDRLDRLAEPQQVAIGTAFGMHTGGRPDLFLVGLATLTLLSYVAEMQPLV